MNIDVVNFLKELFIIVIIGFDVYQLFDIYHLVLFGTVPFNQIRRVNFQVIHLLKRMCDLFLILITFENSLIFVA